jgi:hypothetical protein
VTPTDFENELELRSVAEIVDEIKVATEVRPVLPVIEKLTDAELDAEIEAVLAVDDSNSAESKVSTDVSDYPHIFKMNENDKEHWVDAKDLVEECSERGDSYALTSELFKELHLKFLNVEAVAAVSSDKETVDKALRGAKFMVARSYRLVQQLISLQSEIEARSSGMGDANHSDGNNVQRVPSTSAAASKDWGDAQDEEAYGDEEDTSGDN